MGSACALAVATITAHKCSFALPKQNKGAGTLTRLLTYKVGLPTAAKIKAAFNKPSASGDFPRR